LALVPTAPAAPRFSKRKTLLFSVILFLAFFGALEGLLRIVGVKSRVRPRLILRTIDIDIDFPFMRADPDLFWSPRPGFRGEFLGKTVTINDLGLRGPQVRLPKPAGVRRTVCFGDSITFGYGVGDEETYAFLLGKLLASRGVEAVNAGVTGYTSHQVLGLLARLSPTIGADAATFCIGWNDGTWRPAEDVEYARRLRGSMAVESALDRLYIFRAMKSLYLGSMRGSHDPSVRHNRVPPERYRRNLEAIVEECRRRGIQPIFVGLPHRRRRGEAPIDSPYPRTLAAVARERRVPLLEVSDLDWATPLESNESHFIDSLHFSPSGHVVMASELARQLVALELF
jgi:lysophospholipase L1-like esterase